MSGDRPEKSIKWDRASGAIAVRTNQPLVSPNPLSESHAWNIVTSTGSYLKGPEVVADWVDVPVELLEGLGEG